jgi:hypothetical protein
MSPLKKGVILSLVFHLLILFLSFRLLLSTKDFSDVAITLDVAIEAVQEQEEAASLPKIVKIPEKSAEALPEENEDNVNVEDAKANEEEVAIAVPEQDTMKNINPLEFAINSGQAKINKFLSDGSVLSDSIHQLASPQFPTTKPPFLTTMPSRYADKIDRENTKRNLGNEPTVPLTSLVAGALRELNKLLSSPKKPRIQHIPSDIQLEALNVLWEEEQATDIDIYAQLDTSLRLTATGLNNALADLYQDGIVTRKQVSPKNEFTVLGGVKIEMSAQNRRNKVYEYKAEVKRQEFIDYLNGVLFDVQKQSGEIVTTSDSLRADRLYKKILRIVKID